MALWLTEQQAEMLIHLAGQAAPSEACGLVAGRDGRAMEIIPIRNIAPNPQHHFEMEPRAFVEAMFAIEKRELSLIAVYHSHPVGEAIPSPTDIREFKYPDVDYLIVGLKNSRPRFNAWNIQHGEVNPVKLHIGPTKPVSEPVGSLTNRQRTAVVLSLILAAAFLISVSLVLLPPAPNIP
jgi:proteasome lid subunit RPN8/RPN11